ncbi:DUF2513 domain-containing protein [Pseudomonas aeruginosa]|jgi:hypothetical protein|uniref:DUF2513 domain-containing protein n=1 Tax=Pseudomonas aeruginosa TaxID=287 RepID=UPI000F8301F3|nr:DUF2513 domain-containing protein [Pseudomonas aeruginosa]RTT13496.1 DUF2513 domain-containing protein [Pseudomonas aeruginosa]
MKRDWDIIRAILLELETSTTARTSLSMDAIEGLDAQEVAYNMQLLHEAGYIEASILNSHSGDGKINAALAKRLTNKGHDLLDSIRSETIWRKVKETFISKGVDMTFDLVISVGKKISENLLLL